MTTGIISNYLENKIIDHVLRNTAYTSPGSAIYIALYTDATAQDDADSGTEVSGGSYARINVQAWNAPTSGCTANTNAIDFPIATADWGTVRYVGIKDDINAGNLLFWGQLTADKTISTGDSFSISAGDLDIKLYGAMSYYLGGKVLDHVLRNTAYTSPGADVWAALYTVTPIADGTGGTEVSSGSYARVQISGTGDWDSPTNGSTANTNTETFWTATDSWGNVVGTALLNASTAGSLLFFGNLSGSKSVASGDTFRFLAGAFGVSVS